MRNAAIAAAVLLVVAWSGSPAEGSGADTSLPPQQVFLGGEAGADYDGDGVSDLLVLTGGVAAAISGASGAELWRRDSTEMVRATSIGGDVDFDGRPDVVITSRAVVADDDGEATPNGGAERGSVVSTVAVVSGSDGQVVWQAEYSGSYHRLTDTSPGGSYEHYRSTDEQVWAWGVADRTGDGRPELLVGHNDFDVATIEWQVPDSQGLLWNHKRATGNRMWAEMIDVAGGGDSLWSYDTGDTPREARLQPVVNLTGSLTGDFLEVAVERPDLDQQCPADGLAPCPRHGPREDQLAVRLIDGDTAAPVWRHALPGNTFGSVWVEPDVTGDGVPDVMQFAVTDDLEAGETSYRSALVSGDDGVTAWRHEGSWDVVGFVGPLDAVEGRDLVTVDHLAGGTSVIHRQNGATRAPVGASTAHATGPVLQAGDLDGDGLDDLLIAADDPSGGTVAESTRSGAELWRAAGGGMAWPTGDLDGLGPHDVLRFTLGGTVQALRGLDGTVLWEATAEGPALHAATAFDAERDGADDPVVVSASAPYTLISLDGRDGTQRWTWSVAAGE